MRIVIDRDLCQGHASCVCDAPDVFRLDDEGSLVIVQQTPPEALYLSVKTACEYCPTGAISIID